jgi:D-alanine-D-alanine ligase
MKAIKNIAIVAGGTSSEREVSLRSGANVFKAIRALGYSARLVDPSKEDISKDEFDFAFLALHGQGGEDGSIQGLLEWKGIPYSGSGILASAIAYNKIVTKKLLLSEGLPTAPFLELHNEGDLGQVKTFPQMIKPALEGSSIGVYLVSSAEELRSRYLQLSSQYTNLFVETYIKGREITVSLMGDLVYPILELVPKNNFYDYESKYTPGMTKFILPALLPNQLETQIKQVAMKAYNVVGCRGAVRVDMILDQDRPYILELNTIPGMTDTSDLPAQAKAAGIRFDELVQQIIHVSL